MRVSSPSVQSGCRGGKRAFGDDEVEDGIAEEFEAFVIAGEGFGAAVGVGFAAGEGAVGERAHQELQAGQMYFSSAASSSLTGASIPDPPAKSQCTFFDVWRSGMGLWHPKAGAIWNFAFRTVNPKLWTSAAERWDRLDWLQRKRLEG